MQLKPWQAQKILDIVGPTLGYLGRMLDRMAKRGYAGPDKLYNTVLKDRDALQSLYVELHYQSCKSGVWQSGQSRNRGLGLAAPLRRRVIGLRSGRTVHKRKTRRYYLGRAGSFGFPHGPDG